LGRFRTDFQPVQGTVLSPLIIPFLFVSVDSNGRANTYQSGITPEVNVRTPEQENILNLAYALPASLVTAAFAASIRPVALVSGLPALPSSDYPAGSLAYNTGTGSLYRVASTGTFWQAAVNGAADILANSVGAGVIQAGAISTTQLAAAEILVGAGGGKPTRFRVNDAVGSMVAFIGDNQAGYVGAYMLNLRVGPDINNPVIAASSSGVGINGASFTLTLSGIVTSIANQFDPYLGNYTGLKVSQVSQGYVGVSSSGIVLQNAITGNAIAKLTNGGGDGDFWIANRFGQTLVQLDSFTPSIFVTDASGNGITLRTTFLSFNGVQVLSGRKAAVTLPSGGATIDTQARQAITDIVNRLQTHGLIS